MNGLINLFAYLQSGIFENLVQPALYTLGLIHYDEQAYDAVEFLLIGAIEIALLYAILRPLEAWWPVEKWQDRKAVRADVIYTILHRLGFVPLLLFFLLAPIQQSIEGVLRLHGIIPRNLEDFLPALARSPIALFFVYLLVLDFFDYWRHRLQHRFRWWWALHSLHHSQRQLSFWADDRNHLLDDLLTSGWFAGIALAIGVPPGQFVLIVLVKRMFESLDHANLRLHFGNLGNRILVSPRYHRTHHAVGLGHEGRRQGCNFANLFPVWDLIFGTARLDGNYEATGVRDQLQGRDYGRGFWRQQWLGLSRLVDSIRATLLARWITFRS